MKPCESWRSNYIRLLADGVFLVLWESSYLSVELFGLTEPVGCCVDESATSSTISSAAIGSALASTVNAHFVRISALTVLKIVSSN